MAGGAEFQMNNLLSGLGLKADIKGVGPLGIEVTFKTDVPDRLRVAIMQQAEYITLDTGEQIHICSWGSHGGLLRRVLNQNANGIWGRHYTVDELEEAFDEVVKNAAKRGLEVDYQLLPDARLVYVMIIGAKTSAMTNYIKRRFEGIVASSQYNFCNVDLVC